MRGTRRELFSAIKEKIKTGPFILGIDGRCAAGKTTLAEELRSAFLCNVVHMDDFYLPFSCRTEAVMAQPGGHMDLKRLKKEILQPMKQGKGAVYRPYDCHANRMLSEIPLESDRLTIVEGSFSCHPDLKVFYDFSLFLDVSPKLQMERLKQRNPSRFEAFRTIWIPREEAYFRTFSIPDSCDFILEGACCD